MCWSWGVFLWSTRGHARDEDPRPSHSPIPRLARFSLVARRRCQVLVCTRCEVALRASANAACEPLRPDAPVREPGHSGWLALSDLSFALPGDRSRRVFGRLPQRRWAPSPITGNAQGLDYYRDYWRCR